MNWRSPALVASVQLRTANRRTCTRPTYTWRPPHSPPEQKPASETSSRRDCATPRMIARRVVPWSRAPALPGGPESEL